MSNSFNVIPTLDGLVNITADSITTDSIETNIINVNDEVTTNKMTATGDITQTGGILSIPSFANVGNTLTDYGQRLTGITYDNGTDTTIIDNNLTISGNTTATNIKATTITLGGATYQASRQLKMDGIGVVGDRCNVNSGGRVFNISDTNGLISIARYSSGQAGFELQNYDPTTNVRRSNVLFLGGGATGDSLTCLFRQTGIDIFVYSLTASLFDLGSATATPSLRVRGTYTQIDGKIQQPSSTTTNEMRGITMYADQNLTQSGTGIISQSGTGTNILKFTNFLNDVDISGNLTVDGALNASSVTIINSVNLGPNADVIFSGTGKINQSSSTGVNSMGAITMNSNTDLIQLGSGKITQSATAGTNTMGAITMNSNATLTQSGTGVISQNGTGINTMKTILMSGSLSFNDNNTIYQNPTGTNNLSYTLFNRNLGLGTAAIAEMRDGTSGKRIIFYPNLAGSSYNGLVQAGDNAIISTTDTGGGTLVVGPWSSNNTGIRLSEADGVVNRAGSNINTLSSTGFSSNAQTSITNMTASSSTTTGALVVSGGVGVGGNLNVGGSIAFSGGLSNIPSITYADGFTQYSSRPWVAMGSVEEVSYYTARSLVTNSFCKSITYDHTTVASTVSSVPANTIQYGLVLLRKGESYNGIYFWTGNVDTTFRGALYATGISPARLAQRSTNFTSTQNRWNFMAFDADYLSTETRYAYVALVANGTTSHSTYTFNWGNTNYGSTQTANNLQIIAFNQTGFTGTFPNPFSGTTTASASKYLIGIY
jgi:hypothetical protein